MIRSMWSAVSGLRNHQIYLDVTGNNIANVNTHGYKATRAVFEDSYNQMLRGASAPDAANGVGGMNPSQVGLGVRLGQISGDFKQGGAQVTNVATDMLIQGDGMFVIERGGELFYTRNGAFSLDKEGYLITSDGSYVLSKDADTAAGADNSANRIQIQNAAADPTNGYTSWQIAPNGVITGFNSANPAGKTITTIGVANFNNPQGLERVGGTMFKVTLNSGDAKVGQPSVEGRGLVWNNQLELSNVDLAGEFTNLIMAQRGFQANSKIVTASDEVLNDLINMKR